MTRRPEELKASLKGIVGFGATPFHNDLSINWGALRENAASLAECCDVVVPLGNNGEIFSLSVEEQKRVGRTVVEEVRGRRPVVVGVGFSLPVAIDLASAAEAYAADGVLTLPPHCTQARDEGFLSIAALLRWRRSWVSCCSKHPRAISACPCSDAWRKC